MLKEKHTQKHTSLGQNWANHAVAKFLQGHGYESVTECVLLFFEHFNMLIPNFKIIWRKFGNQWLEPIC